MVGPSKTTQPFGIGSPRPGMRRSASMRPMLGGKAFDGLLPDYSAAALNRYVARSRKDLDALARLERTDGLSRAARLELGVLQGMLLSELSEIEDQRLPHSFPPYFLFRLNIVNYLLR